MKRRDFIGVLGGAAAAWPLVARAQQPNKVFRLAFVSSVADLSETGQDNSLFVEFRRLGYVEGQNLVVLRFSAQGDASRYDTTVREAVNSSPDVILVTGTNHLALLWQNLAMDWRNWIERSRCRGVRGEVA